MTGAGHTLRLLPRKELIKTGEVDHADWNFRPLLGRIVRRRYRLVAALLGGRHFRRLAEVGYGSGVFLPGLAPTCAELHGVDVHRRKEEVGAVLARFGVRAALHTADMEALPFLDGYFDCLVAVSTLEFVGDLEAGCREARRVLAPGGLFVVVTPGASSLADLGLRVLTGRSARADFADRRRAVLPALLRHFRAERRLTVPRFGTSLVHLYTGLALTPLEADGRAHG
jgi:ubiquinone/menaquinone biosynthesis C-methylase UbiE